MKRRIANAGYRPRSDALLAMRLSGVRGAELRLAMGLSQSKIDGRIQNALLRARRMAQEVKS